MLAQLLRKHGIGARVVPSEAVSAPNLFGLDVTGVQMAFLCYLEPGSFTNPRYLVRRLRRKLPKATIVAGFWTLKRDEIEERNALTATGADLDALAQLIHDRDIVVLSDEVYEHVVFDGGRHNSVLTHAGLASRSFAVFSFGKTLHATGLRVGYCVAPAALTRELRKVHQFNTFSIAHPLQHAIAAYLAEQPDCGRGLAGFFQAKRDRLRRALSASGFSLPPAQGTYFQLLDFSAFAASDDLDFAERLLTQARVATIPLSPFYASPPALPFVRLCIAKQDSTLDEAALRLNAFAARLRKA